MESLVEKIIDWSRVRPDKTALVDVNQSLTYGELGRRIQSGACMLKQLGVKKGEAVLIQAAHLCSFFVGVFAIHLAGGICVPIDNKTPINNVLEIVKSTDSRFFIGEAAVPGIQTLSYALLENDPSDVYTEFPKSEDLSDLFFTTGTTGKPKGVMYDHGALVAVVENLIYGSHMESDTVYLVYGPLNHVFSVRKVYYTLYCGCTAVLLNGLVNVKKFFQMMGEYGVTATHLLPAAAKMLFKLTRDRIGEYRNQLVFIETGTAPFPEEDKTRLRSLLPKTRLYFGYGCSEADCATKLEYSRYPDKLNCVGQKTIHTTIKIVDGDRKEIQSSRQNPGYVAIKGRMTMVGYWKEPELTAAVLSDGFIYTNDIGYFDDEGFLYILGRDGDVINVGGIKVSAKEIEEKALQHPAIEDCAVIPIPDPISTQAPKLFVQIKAGEAFDEKEIMAFLSQFFETYMLPRVIVQIDAIPRTFNGKIMKNRLK